MDELLKWIPQWFALLFLSVLIGGLIGLEQESYHRKIEEKHFGGIRTFPLISMMGFTVQYFIQSITLTAVVFFGFALMIVGEYMYEAIYFNRKGITTEVAGLITFVMLSIVITLILSMREFLHSFIEKYIYRKDVTAILKFLIITAILYPILPNKSFTFLQLNPRSIWVMVILISTISFAAYFATKLLGPKRGILMTAIFGGLMSSTAVTLAFSKRSKETPELSGELAMGIILASSIMFIRQWLIMFIIYPKISYGFFFFSIVMFFFGMVFALKKPHTSTTVDVEFSNPYDITHALFFGAFYTVILVLSKLAHMYLGSKGMYLLGFVSGLADVDPLTVSMSQLARTKVVELSVALISIIISSITNTLVKGVYAYMFGHKDMKNVVWKAFLVMTVVSIVFVVFLAEVI